MLARRSIPGHEAIRFSATLLCPEVFSKPLGARYAYDTLRQLALQSDVGEVKVTECIRTVVEDLVDLYDNDRLAAVTSIAHARLLAVAIMMSDRFSRPERETLLRYWENISFLVFGLHRKDARTAVGDYTRAAQNVFLGKVATVADVKATMQEIVSGYSVSAAIDMLRACRDCYTSWEQELRYLLARYEEHLCRQAGESVRKETWQKIWSLTPAKSIEHVLPQNPGKGWDGKLGNGQALEKHVHRLGNLVLMPPGLNAKASNEALSVKKMIYANEPLRHVRDVAAERDWTLQSIEDREGRIFDWMREEWGSRLFAVDDG